MRTIPSQFLCELEIEPRCTEKPEEKNTGNCLDDGDVKYSHPAFADGQLVRHKSFGLGRVKEFIDMGEDSIVVVHFNTGQTKSLLVKYANLSIP
jgi:hypothetical protein